MVNTCCAKFSNFNNISFQNAYAGHDGIDVMVESSSSSMHMLDSEAIPVDLFFDED